MCHAPSYLAVVAAKRVWRRLQISKFTVAIFAAMYPSRPIFHTAPHALTACYAAYCYRCRTWSVCLSVCCAKTAEQIDLCRSGAHSCGSKEPCIRWTSRSDESVGNRKGQDNNSAMRPFAKFVCTVQESAVPVGIVSEMTHYDCVEWNLLPINTAHSRWQ